MSEVSIRAEFPAVVLKVLVAKGDTVAAGQTVLLLESMKTEIPVAAPAAGKVVEAPAREGELVEERQVLLVLET